MIIHRYPIGDTKPHYDSVDCPCHPTLYEGDGEDLVMHHAFDGRDIIIAVEIHLGMRCEGCGHYMNEKGEHTGPPPPYEEADPPAL